MLIGLFFAYNKCLRFLATASALLIVLRKIFKKIFKKVQRNTTNNSYYSNYILVLFKLINKIYFILVQTIEKYTVSNKSFILLNVVPGLGNILNKFMTVAALFY